ncbi:hypothetical protein [Ideonella sp. B508-1]|uniref:hypothetical protein n=1 Tax=Ideonella sp. B508-1 TaxID=137716 RepID=UPI00034904AB|nr:hypothetical protein [Ideonella sp. B508-1]
MTRDAAPQSTLLHHAADAMALPIRLDDEFVLRLPQDPDELTLAELDELRQWLDDTLRADRRHYLVLGSCAQDSHETRSEALTRLTERLVALGVEPDTIRCTHDGVNLPRGVDAELHQRVVRLKAVEGAQMARASVQPISQLFLAA